MIGYSFSGLRIIGLVVAFGAIVLLFRLFRSRRIRRIDFALGFVLATFAGIVSLNPNILNFLVEVSQFKLEAYGRLLTLLVITNGCLWLLWFYERVKRVSNEEKFDLLVRALVRDEFELITAPRKGTPLMVVIPAYNEAENIAHVLRNMPERINGKEVGVLVIDDGSEDETAELARSSGAWVVCGKVHRGQGASLRIGWDIAAHVGAEIVVTMDADGQHDPQEIPDLIQPILEGDCDFVIGSRILGSSDAATPIRHTGIIILNRLINFLVGTKITDCSSGFRAFRVGRVKDLLLREDQFMAGEIIVESARHGLCLTEVPITIKPRASGTSKKGKDWKYGLQFVKGIIKAWWR